MRWLAFSLLGLGCAQPTVSAFDQSCEAPEDCVAVWTGSSCSTSCRGQWGSIREDEQARWDGAMGDWRRTQCVGVSQLLLACEKGQPVLGCVEDSCTVIDVVFEAR
jgi:hypothetical protein